MSKRSGQVGQVFLRNDRWVGRFYVDVPGTSKRRRRALVLGMKRELSRSEAKRKLLDILTQEGVNTPTYLERSLRPPTRFSDVADEWELKRLPQLKESSRYMAPRLIAKYLRPCFGQTALDEIKTGTVNDWIMDLQGKCLAPKTIHNLWKLFRAIMNWYSQQNDEPLRKWYPSLPTIPDVEQRWFTQQEIGRIVKAAEGQYKVLFHLAGVSAMRAGELFGLHVEDLDMNRGVIHVRRSVWRGQEVSPKTRKATAKCGLIRPRFGCFKNISGAAHRVVSFKPGTELRSTTMTCSEMYFTRPATVSTFRAVVCTHFVTAG